MKGFICTLLICCCGALAAQQLTPEVVASSGATFTDGNLSLEWTLGEVMTATITAGNLTLTQGFHQPVPFDNTLPVSWLSFTAAAGAKEVYLNWETTLETENAGFYVERSADGREWAVLGEVSPRTDPDQRYRFTDESPLAGQNLYRIRQTDFDGQVTYSPVEAVRFHAATAIRVYPNPVTEVLTVDLPEEATFLGAYDLVGRRVPCPSWREQGRVKIDVAGLPAGAYVCRVKLADGEVHVRHVVVR